MEHNTCKQEKIIGGMQEQIRTLFEVTKKQDGLIETMHALTLEIRGLTTEMKSVKEDIGEVKKDVIELKNKPAKRWDSISDTIIKVAVGGIISYLLIRAGLGV